MALDLSALSAYIDEKREPLIGNSVLSARTAKLLANNIQTGVKGTSALNILNTTTVFGDGSTCGWDEAGTSILTQRNIVTGQIKINKSFCEKTFIGTWADYKVKMAAGTKTLPFEQDFLNSEISSVGAVGEVALWQGDTDSVSANLNKFDGFIKVLSGASYIDGNPLSVTGITSDNIMDVIYGVYNLIPAGLLTEDDLVIFAGADTFRLAVNALAEKNLFHYKYDINGDMSFMIPGTNVKLIAVNGLNATNTIVAGRLSNFYIGTDLVGDSETIEFFYSQDNREFRLVIEFNLGVQVAFPDEVVMFLI